MNKSMVFIWYNKARRAAKSGKLDAERVNRALGLLCRKDQTWRKKYHPSVSSCTCPDHRYNKTVCKHMIAMMIEHRGEQSKPQPQPLPLPGYEARNGDWVVALQETCKTWRIYVFFSANQAREYINTHPGRWVNPSAVRGKRLYPDTVIRKVG